MQFLIMIYTDTGKGNATSKLATTKRKHNENNTFTNDDIYDDKNIPNVIITPEGPQQKKMLAKLKRRELLDKENKEYEEDNEEESDYKNNKVYEEDDSNDMSSYHDNELV